jgi:hypothetical protein
MYIERSMKEKGMLVTQSNQKPVRDDKLRRASARMSSQYRLSSVWYPTKNCRRTSACARATQLQVTRMREKIWLEDAISTEQDACLYSFFKKAIRLSESLRRFGWEQTRKKESTKTSKNRVGKMLHGSS